jgi:transposase
MMTGRHDDRLENWIADVERDTLAPLASFARKLRRDLDAVRNGLSLPHSSGAVEGNINRLILWNQRCQAVCLCITPR